MYFRSRRVNTVQSDIILNKMQNNRSIARGFVNISKEVLAEFWNSLTDELNSAGPPIKNVAGWKKVWIDQKRYVRSKSAPNMKIQRETGGPTQTKCLSVNKKSIYELVVMKESVEGLQDSSTFGVPTHFDGNEKINKSETPPRDKAVDVFTEAPSCSKQVTPPPQDPTINKESSVKKETSFLTEPKKKLAIADLNAQEVATQENLSSIISQVGDSIQKHNKEMEIGIKRVYRALEKCEDLKAKKIKILEQHHLAMEQLHIKEVESKIEKNRRIIEIEELKLKILMKKN